MVESPAMEGRRPALREETVFIWVESGPSDRDSTIKIRRYPFAVKFSKETLGFLETNPRSLAHSRKLRFHI
jgi:hypothetical protein